MVMISYLWTLPQLYHIFFRLVAIRATYFSTVSCGSYLFCRRRYRAEPWISLGMYSPNKFCSCCKWSCVAFASHFARWMSNWRSLIAVSGNTDDSCLSISWPNCRCPAYHPSAPPLFFWETYQKRPYISRTFKKKRHLLCLPIKPGNPESCVDDEFRFSKIRPKA